MSTLSNATGNTLPILPDDIKKYIDSKLDSPSQRITGLAIEVENLKNRCQAETADRQKEMQVLREFVTRRNEEKMVETQDVKTKVESKKFQRIDFQDTDWINKVPDVILRIQKQVGRLEDFKEATLLTYVESQFELPDKPKETATAISIDPSLLVKITEDLRKVGERLTTKLKVIESAYDEVQEKVLSYDSVKYEKMIKSQGQQIQTLEGLTSMLQFPSTFLSYAEFKAIYNLFDGMPKLELLFEAKKHDFRSRAFHAACDNKGPTLIVAKSKKGCIFGWFTTVEWKSSGDWVANESDSTTWVFKVESPDKVPKYVMKETGSGFLHSSYYGPSIYPLNIRDRANEGEKC